MKTALTEVHVWFNNNTYFISVVTDSESATESADSLESVCVRIRESFAAVCDGFGSSVRKSIFTYQVAAFKRRCVTVCGRQCGRVGD